MHFFLDGNPICQPPPAGLAQADYRRWQEPCAAPTCTRCWAVAFLSASTVIPIAPAAAVSSLQTALDALLDEAARLLFGGEGPAIDYEVAHGHAAGDK